MQSSKLEQHCIVKPGSTCLVGNCFYGVPWCEKIMEYLLITSMKRQNFKKIYLLLLDKRLTNLLAVENTDHGKLHVVKSMEELLNSLFAGKRGGHDGSTGIFLYSISELILRSSLRKTTTAFQQLLSLASGKGCNVHLFTFINSSLHDLSTISYITAMADAVATIIPNDGSSLSLEVAAEVHIVRRSQSSTKITEDIEMFEWRESRLHPRPSVRILDPNVSLEESDTLDTAPNEVQIFQKSHSRLITFDSTDPEFDDDDDPDADLDL